jgi:DNA recombination protein RmuC
MNQTLFFVNDLPIHAWQAALALLGVMACVLLLLVIALLRAITARGSDAAVADRRQHELAHKLAGLEAANAQLAGRMQAMAEVLGSRQSDLARLMADRLDAVGQRVGHGLDQAARGTFDHLSKLNERLAVIDAAQSRLTGLTEQVVGLKEILSNKQSRGAYGQGRMEAIVRDSLPSGAYRFQAGLSNGTRPDCLVRLPGDDRCLVIDAKFPLEAFSALKAARGEDARQAAMQRVRTDFGKHVKDMAERYLIAGETQDMALLFVPAESVYADLNEHFDDIVQKALRQRIIIVSPTLLMMAIQVMQAIVRDARMREQAHVIQAEVRKLLDDVARMGERVVKLETHFRMAEQDLAGLATSAGKVTKRAGRIEAMDFEAAPLAEERRAAE